MNDKSIPPDARRREDAAIRNETRFEDFMLMYKADKESSQLWRDSVDKRLAPLEDLYRTLSTPAKVLGALIVLMLTPTAGVLGYALFKRALEWATRVVENGR